MVFQTRSITIAATAWQNGIRVYTQSGDGNLREGCLNKDVEKIMPQQQEATITQGGPFAMIGQMVANIAASQGLYRSDQSEGWFCGQLHASCDPGSTLCCISWGNNWNLSVLYQEHDGTIRELRHYDQPDWYVTDFQEPDALPGTDIDEVHSSDAQRIMTFFQDKEGYLCYRKASGFRWEPKVRITKVAPASAITATTWNDMADIRVYCQDASNTIIEYCGSFNGNWSRGQFTTSSPTIMGSMAAISWQDPSVHIRLYLQDAQNNVIEWCYDGSWQKGATIAQGSLPNCDLAAFTRTNHEGRWIHVYWAGADKVLHQRVFGPGRGWIEQTPIGFLKASGQWEGSTKGNHFTDLDSAVDAKVIRAIHVQSGSWVDGFNVEFTDGSQTPWRGGRGGVLQHFVLEDGEDITQISVCSNGEHISKMCFLTSKGRSSIWFGIEGSSMDIWDLDGAPLAGFAGCASDFVYGLQPLWSERPAKTGVDILNRMVSESATMQGDINKSKDTITQQQQQLQQLNNNLTNSLHDPASDAINTIVQLGQLAAQLSTAPAADHNTTIAKCKTVSLAANAKFEKMHTMSQGMLKDATNLATESTYQEATAQTRQKRVKEMQQVSAATRASEANLRQMRQARVEDAKQHILTAQATKREAEQKRESAKSARIVRDIFTFGLGELGDWGGLNEAIDYANKLIDSAESNLNTCNTAVQLAEASVRRIDEELRQFDSLDANLKGFMTVLHDQAVAANDVVQKTRDLENHTLDAAVFLSSLCGKTSPLFAQHTARQLAASVLAIEATMKIGAKLAGAFIDNPGSLDDALNAIASSPVAPQPADGMM